MVSVSAELHGTIISVDVAVGQRVAVGSVLAMVESMKLHHDVVSSVAGVVDSVRVGVGETVHPGDVLFEIGDRESTQGSSGDLGGDAVPSGEASASSAGGPQPNGVPTGLSRPDLNDVIERHALGLDAARSEAVERRHKSGRRTARENIADLIDDGSMIEYGPLAIAAQRRRRDHDDLIRNTPADGLVGGLATVNGDLFQGRDARTIVMSYDYMVLAGTQGARNHLKKDRLFELAEDLRLPVVFYTEGGGGRPGDTDVLGSSLLDCLAFLWLAELSGTVPLVGVNSGYCFAGNAAILGCCDVVIATKDSNIGMGGPAMIEGGGLGVFAPTEIGPIEVQRANGVVDIVAEDEADATAIAKKYLSYFQGRLDGWACSDQALLRDAVPLDRMRAYEIRNAIDLLVDTDTLLELRRDFGLGMITALARIEGRPIGLIANNPSHLAGAIDSDGADKAARFMQLCDAHGLPIVTMVDTPGMMVGPEVEATALVRHCSRLFVTAANVSVPMISIVVRKAYGLGAQAMMGGSTKAPLATIAWPTGEFGPMGLEGFVRLGYRKELEAEVDPAERERLFQTLVAKLYEQGKALSTAEYFEIDDVIDPADTRRWLTTLLESCPPRDPTRVARPNIDTW